MARSLPLRLTPQKSPSARARRGPQGERPGLGEGRQRQHVRRVVLGQALDAGVRHILERLLGDHLNAGRLRYRDEARRQGDLVGLQHERVVTLCHQLFQRQKALVAAIFRRGEGNDRRRISFRQTVADRKIGVAGVERTPGGAVERMGHPFAFRVLRAPNRRSIQRGRKLPRLTGDASRKELALPKKLAAL
jgi:hypothetical protein